MSLLFYILLHILSFAAGYVFGWLLEKRKEEKERKQKEFDEAI